MEIVPRGKRRVLAVLTVILAGAGLWSYAREYVSISNNVNGREMPICSVETEEKRAALTFDVAWGTEDLEQILDILKEREVRASFFLTGEWVSKHPEGVKAIYEGGHDLGNHSETHRNFKPLPQEEKQAEILGVHRKAKELTGADMILFRPPYGDYDDEVIRSAEEEGYYTILWNVDSMDWKDYGAEAIVRTVLEHPQLGNGSILRFHCGTKYTADALGEVLDGLAADGYELVPVSELIYREDYHMDVNGRQIQGLAP